MPPSVPDGGFEPGTIPFEYFDFCIRVGELQCQAQDRCCTIPERRFPDLATCRLAFAELCANLALSMSWLEGRSTWHEDREEPLLNAVWDAASRCAAVPFDPDTHEVLSGDIARGGDCTPPGLEEPYLQWVDHVCEEELRCAVSGTPESFTGRCSDLGAAGDPCSFFGGCDPAHYCAVTRHWLGTCEPRRARGEPCTFDREGLGDYCPDDVGRCAPSRPPWCLVES